MNGTERKGKKKDRKARKRREVKGSKEKERKKSRLHFSEEKGDRSQWEKS